jgi:hypothetical protein
MVRVSVIGPGRRWQDMWPSEVLGPWSLATSRRFWEGFTLAAVAGEPAGPGLHTVFCVEGDWRRAEVEVTQAGMPRTW